MRTFRCGVCEQPVFFENVQCMRCDAKLGFVPSLLAIAALKPSGDDQFRACMPGSDELAVKACKNSVDHGVCSWVLEAHDENAFCLACRLNVTIPNLAEPGAKAAWAKLERAKRRLLYGLLDLGLTIEPEAEQSEHGLRFAFMADRPDAAVFIGQSDGLITINTAEADAPFREKIRGELGEPYRTLLGHFRHEIGHYFWDRLIRDQPVLESYRAEFGDERADYRAALERHYAQGAPSDWPERFVSAYASSHPWEDWAETWAHYLHIVDTLDTARHFKLVVAEAGSSEQPPGTVAAAKVDPNDFERVIQAWVPLTIAVNSLNRSMGVRDMYPFVLSPRAVHKLRFVHDLVHAAVLKLRAVPPAPTSHEAQHA